MLGDPDLLRREGDRYVAGDIKSGAGEEGSQDLSKPKKHYAVQLGLYTDILERKGLSAEKRGFIWDINGQEVVYDFTEPHGKGNPRTLWEDYQDCLAEAQAIVGKSTETLAAYSGVCKLCHWYSACISRLTDANDLTLIPEHGAWIRACTPRPLDSSCVNPQATFPYGCKPEHVFKAMEEFLDFLLPFSCPCSVEGAPDRPSWEGNCCLKQQAVAVAPLNSS